MTPEIALGRVCITNEPWSRPEGPAGSMGPPNKDPLPEGKSGDDGVTLQRVVSPSVLGSWLSPAYAAMLLNAASSDYLNARHVSAIERLQWLSLHLAPLTVPSTIPSGIKGLADRDVNQDDARHFAVLKSRADSLLRQLALGLDYHGQVANHVSLLSESFFKNTLDHLMALAASIENTWMAYARAKGKTDEAIASARRAKDEYLKVVALKNHDRTQATAQTASMLGALQTLDARRDELWTRLHTASADFKRAVQTRAQGCDFGRLVAIAAACSTLVATGGTSMAAWGSAAALFTENKESSKAEPKKEDASEANAKPRGLGYVVTTLSAVVTTTDEFAREAEKFKRLLEGDSGSALPTLPLDDVKLLTTADSLKEQLTPYLSAFPEASVFRNLIQEFVDICTARNNQVLEYNNYLAFLKKLEFDVEQAVLDANLLQDAIARNSDPFLAEVVSMMENIRQESLAYVVKLLVRVHSSYKYFSLDDESTLPISDLSIETLKAARFNVWKKYTEEKASLGSPSTVLDRVPVSLAALVGEEGLRKLQTNRQVTFVLPPEHPDFIDLCKVLVGRVDVSFYSQGKALNDYGVTLVHHGQSLIFDAQGRPHIYSHLPLRVPYRVQGGRETVYGNTNQEDYVGVSPYGPWTLELDTHTTVKDLSEVVLGMSGHCRSRNRPV